MRFLFVVHKNEEKAEQNSVLFHRLTLKERGLRPNGYFPLMRQPLWVEYLFLFLLPNRARERKRQVKSYVSSGPRIRIQSANADSLCSSFDNTSW